MKTKLSRIFHAGYLMESGECRIAFDPVFENPMSGNAHAFPPLRFDISAIQNLRIDAVFISHYHDDHCSFDSLKLLDRQTPIYIYCIHEELLDWLRELGFKEVYELKLNQTVSMGPIRVTARRALDVNVDSLLQIQTDDLNLLNVVDAWIDEQTLDLLTLQKPWDLILWPFQTMRELEVLAPQWSEPASPQLPVEWRSQLQRLSPRFLIPSSCQFQFEDWSWLNRHFFPVSYRVFSEQVAEWIPQTQLFRLEPGQSVEWTQGQWRAAGELPWIQRLTETVADYIYDPSVAPQTTAEIATHFSRLGDSDEKAVVDFCRNEIPERFGLLAPSEDPFFAIPRTWVLKLYDHEGRCDTWTYTIHGNLIRLLSSPGGSEASGLDVAWQTELPKCKILSALHHGEALTSMYLRINGHKITGPLAQELRLADPLLDPLIRALYEGQFGQYQLAQLRRIQFENSL